MDGLANPLGAQDTDKNRRQQQRDGERSRSSDDQRYHRADRRSAVAFQTPHAKCRSVCSGSPIGPGSLTSVGTLDVPRRSSKASAAVYLLLLTIALAASSCAANATGSNARAVLRSSHQSTTTATPPGREVESWRLTPDRVTSRHWQYINLPTVPPTPSDGFNVRSVGLLTMTVSAAIAGAPIELRWLDNGAVEKPSSVSFAPRPDDNAFSYTFTDSGNKEFCGHTLRLQWRSATGHKASLRAGDVVIDDQPAKADSGICP